MSTHIFEREYALWFRIDRPDSGNAIDFRIMDQLEVAVERLHRDESIRAFVLTGTGDYFISGGDLRKFHQIKNAETAMNMAERMQAILTGLEKAPCWTIALINGAAYGGGWETMLACDFCVASDHAKFGFTQGKFYLPPGWGGLTRLVEKVGRSKAILWLAEASVIDAETALQNGLIEYCFHQKELEEKVQEWLKVITRNDRMFIQNLKTNAFISSQHRRENMRKELEPFSHFWVHEEHEIRVQKFLDKEDH